MHYPISQLFLLLTVPLAALACSCSCRACTYALYAALFCAASRSTGRKRCDSSLSEYRTCSKRRETDVRRKRNYNTQTTHTQALSHTTHLASLRTQHTHTHTHTCLVAWHSRRSITLKRKRLVGSGWRRRCDSRPTMLEKCCRNSRASWKNVFVRKGEKKEVEVLTRNCCWTLAAPSKISLHSHTACL